MGIWHRKARKTNARNRQKRRLRYESLEKRELKAVNVALIDGVLDIEGTDGSERIYIEHNLRDDSEIEVRVQAAPDYDLVYHKLFDVDKIDKIVARLKDGDDKYYNLTRVTDVVFGGSGNDEIQGGHSASYLDGGAGNDTLWGRGGHDFLYGGSGGDILFGGNGNDYLFGGDGYDELYGDDDADYLDGGADRFSDYIGMTQDGSVDTVVNWKARTTYFVGGRVYSWDYYYPPEENCHIRDANDLVVTRDCTFGNWPETSTYDAYMKPHESRVSSTMIIGLFGLVK